MIVCKYTCKTCGINDQAVEVSPRTHGQPVVEWVRDIVGLAVGFDHMLRSPHCTAKNMTHVKIPIPKGGDGIGESVDKELP